MLWRETAACDSREPLMVLHGPTSQMKSETPEPVEDLENNLEEPQGTNIYAVLSDTLFFLFQSPFHTEFCYIYLFNTFN